MANGNEMSTPRIRACLTRMREGSEVGSDEVRSTTDTDLNVEEVSAVVVDVAYHVYHDVGPGLLESVYEAVMANSLEARGLRVVRQMPVPIAFAGICVDEGFRADLVVADRLIVELKSVEVLAPVHPKQLRTYLRLMDMPVGILINFGAATFSDGIRRIVNAHQNIASSKLLINTHTSEGTKR